MGPVSDGDIDMTKFQRSEPKVEHSVDEAQAHNSHQLEPLHVGGYQ